MHKPCKLLLSREDVAAAIQYHLNVNVFQFEAAIKVTGFVAGAKFFEVALESATVAGGDQVRPDEP